VAQVSDQAPAPPDLPVVDAGPRVRADAERNREKVLCAARQLFSEHGVENVSMDAIAAAAGVGKGTLFRRFGDRAGLALALLEEQTRQLQEDAIRGPAPLGPPARPRERLKAIGRAQLALLDDHADLMAAGERGRARFQTGPYGFLRLHISLLVREADPDADWELITEFLLAPLSADTFVYCRNVRGFGVERLIAAFEDLVDRVLPH
jgi:AcrR family transcriptional regulator